MDNVKRAQVIMLPTNIAKSEYNQLWLCKNDILYNATAVKGIESHKETKFQELYIVSDDEIKKSDWYYTPIKRSIEQCIKKLLIIKNGSNDIEQFKIIATTDTSLTYNKSYNSGWNAKINLPQPSQQFIEKYIESYNKGEVITDVLVEYELYMQRQSNVGTTRYVVSKDNKTFNKLNFDRIPTLLEVKINPKDNTITIKKLKDSWNRKELITEIEAFAQTYGLVSEGNKWTKKL